MSHRFDPVAWLDSLGLGEYGELFERNAVDADVLTQLTADDLREMGVSAVGHRRKILNAAATFGDVQTERSARRPSFPWQRRRATLCFFDMVGFTERSTAMDPEDIRDLIDRFYSIVERDVETLGGRVVKRLGDGLLVGFGWPVAHEDDARRAVVAALAARDSITASHDDIDMKVGIATGLVLAGGHDGNGDVLGDAVNMAARLQQAAGPGEILISEGTRAQMRGAAETQPSGDLVLKGFPEPVSAHRVLRPTDPTDHVSADADRLFGRSAEIKSLEDLWHGVRSGRGAVGLVTGQPGIGKTQLAQHVAAIARASGAALHWGVCREWLAMSALHPLLGIVARVARIPPECGQDEFVQGVTKALATLTPEHATCSFSARAIASLRWPGAAEGLGVGPKERRNAAFAAIRTLLFPADRAPTVIVVEDLHWADPSTLEFLQAMCGDIDHCPILLLLTSRDEMPGGILPREFDLHLRLDGLAPRDARLFVMAECENSEVEDDVVDAVLARSGGVPLFLAELSRTIGQESEVERDGRLPAQIGDVLTARIDMLGDRKGLALAAACIGREFAPELLARVVGMVPEITRRDLEQVAHTRIIERRGDRFRFAHALLRDAAYQLLPHSERRHLHARILDEVDPSSVAPELLARHAILASNHEQAARWAQEAGRRALGNAALREAITHFTLAIEALEQIDDTAEASRERSWLTLKLAHAYNGVEGSGGSQTAASFERAMAMGREFDPSGVFFPASYGCAVTQFVRGALDRAEATARDMLERSECDATLDQPVNHAMMAQNAVATILMLRGEFESSEKAFRKVERSEAEADVKALIWQYGHDPRGVLRAHRALALVGLGEPTRALTVWAEGLDLVNGGAHRQSIAQPLVFGALLHMILERRKEARDLLDRALALTRELDLAMWRNFADCLDGWIRLESGDPIGAEAVLAVAMGKLEAMGVVYLRPWCLSVRSATAMSLGKQDEANLFLAAARAHQDRTGERWAGAMRMPTRGSVRRTRVEAMSGAG